MIFFRKKKEFCEDGEKSVLNILELLSTHQWIHRSLTEGFHITPGCLCQRKLSSVLLCFMACFKRSLRYKSVLFSKCRLLLPTFSAMKVIHQTLHLRVRIVLLSNRYHSNMPVNHDDLP